MLSGLSGTLLSHQFVERTIHVEFAGRLGEVSFDQARTQLREWWSRHGSQLGPASSTRAIWNASAALADLLGFLVEPPTFNGNGHCALAKSGDARIALIVGHWTLSLDSVWRDAVRHGIAMDAPWSLCANGHQVRLVDARRTYSRAHLQFELAQTIENPPTLAFLWAVLRAAAFKGEPRSLIRELLASAARHGQSVNRSLSQGVIEAVGHLLNGLQRCGRRHPMDLFDESLTVVYRVLFLMFAEARGLVPTWHPIYRQSYTIESLRERIERPGPAHGVWEALQAISRLAHRGCRAGSLVVPAFNGRLFSPRRSPVAESCAVEDDVARRALLAISTTSAKSRRVRIDYRDLGVEQLGAVYEGVLDFVPLSDQNNTRHIVLRRGGDLRKSTGSFYTPQPLTDYVVRRTLCPLVAGAASGDILRLRVVDPSMGSAAFLVSACRYLAGAYERALLREDACRENDLTESDRAGFRRSIAQRCLFGVDLNPTAVQLARLSLWLATLSAGKPLTFLDHRLTCGDSLLGASPADVARQPPSGRTRVARERQSPLFSDADFEPSLAEAVGTRRWIAEAADDSVEVVKEKEQRLESLSDLDRWRTIADLWCACWMWPEGEPTPTPGVFASLLDEILQRHVSLPKPVSAALHKRAACIARERRLFHWVLEFPEIYFDDTGKPLANPGFDAVLGNPPWDMLDARAVEKNFLRSSGIYRHQGAGRINRYQLFLERALTLTRRGGRIGLILPSGFATDHTAASLRRKLLHGSDVDTISGFDNRRAIFPIHRSLRFLIATLTTGSKTHRIACGFGMTDLSKLDEIPDSGDHNTSPTHPVTVTPDLLGVVSGESLAIPDLRTAADARILESIVRRVPRLGGADGWNVRFGRELNATEDRRHFFIGRSGLPVIEGKHIEPFRTQASQTALRISRGSAARLLDAHRTFLVPRLAYRDVASPTNRLTMIAAIIPAGVVTTHSLFCLKTALARTQQTFLCGMLNSYVANYLIRLVMTTHLGSSTVEQLRVPCLAGDSPLFIEIVELSRALEVEDSDERGARLQALAARCYQIDAADFEHILGTFPLVPDAQRAAALEAFVRLDSR